MWTGCSKFWEKPKTLQTFGMPEYLLGCQHDLDNKIECKIRIIKIRVPSPLKLSLLTKSSTLNVTNKNAMKIVLTLLKTKVGYSFNGRFSFFHIFIKCHKEGLFICSAFLTNRNLGFILIWALFTVAVIVFGFGQRRSRLTFYLEEKKRWQVKSWKLFSFSFHSPLTLHNSSFSEGWTALLCLHIEAFLGVFSVPPSTWSHIHKLWWAKAGHTKSAWQPGGCAVGGTIHSFTSF